MTAGALEGVVLTLEFVTVDLVASISTVVFVVAPPPRGNTLSIGALEFALGTISVNATTSSLRFVAAVSTIIGEIAEPLLGYASVVGALELGVRVAFGTALGSLIRAISAVVFAIAEQPLGYAAVVSVAWATLPARRAVTLSTHERRFVAVVAAVIVKVTHPQFRNALAVLTAELRIWVAGSGI